MKLRISIDILEVMLSNLVADFLCRSFEFHSLVSFLVSVFQALVVNVVAPTFLQLEVEKRVVVKVVFLYLLHSIVIQAQIFLVFELAIDVDDEHVD